MPVIRCVIFSAVFGACLSCATGAPAQTREENWKRCADTNPDLSIDGCTALIQSGRESTQNLATAFFNRGIAYWDKKDYDRAIQDYDQAIRLRPDYATAFNNRGHAYAFKDDYDRAIRDYDQAIRLKPDYAAAFSARGSVYAGGKRDYDRAIEDYDQAIKLKPDYALALNYRCLARAFANKALDAALVDCNQAVRLQPSGSHLGSRGLVHFRRAEYDKAIADCNASLEINPKLASSLYVRGLARQRNGDLKTGSADIAAAKAIDPDIDTRYAGYGVAP